jgi:hypothetical protein
VPCAINALPPLLLLCRQVTTINQETAEEGRQPLNILGTFRCATATAQNSLRTLTAVKGMPLLPTHQ